MRARFFSLFRIPLLFVCYELSHIRDILPGCRMPIYLSFRIMLKLKIFFFYFTGELSTFSVSTLCSSIRAQVSRNTLHFIPRVAIFNLSRDRASLCQSEKYDIRRLFIFGMSRIMGLFLACVPQMHGCRNFQVKYRSFPPLFHYGIGGAPTVLNLNIYHALFVIVVAIQKHSLLCFIFIFKNNCIMLQDRSSVVRT